MGVWGGGYRCINALTRMQQQHTTDIPSGLCGSISSKEKPQQNALVKRQKENKTMLAIVMIILDLQFLS